MVDNSINAYIEGRLNAGDKLEDILKNIADTANEIEHARTRLQVAPVKSNNSFMKHCQEDNTDLNDVVYLFTHNLARDLGFTQAQLDKVTKEAKSWFMVLENRIKQRAKDQERKVNKAKGTSAVSGDDKAKEKYLNFEDVLYDFLKVFDLL